MLRLLPRMRSNSQCRPLAAALFVDGRHTHHHHHHASGATHSRHPFHHQLTPLTTTPRTRAPVQVCELARAWQSGAGDKHNSSPN